MLDKLLSNIQAFSLLGPFFRMSTLDFVHGVDKFFAEPYTPEKEREITEFFRARLHIGVLVVFILFLNIIVSAAQKGTKELLLTILRSGGDKKEKVLDWIAATHSRFANLCLL